MSLTLSRCHPCPEGDKDVEGEDEGQDKAEGLGEEGKGAWSCHSEGVV